MFTGIIKNLGKIAEIKEKNQSIFVDIFLPKKWKLKMGQSISINGICSTVRQITKKTFQVEYMPETIKKTTVSNWSAGLPVNLEQGLTLNDLVDGHLVSGHIDTVAKIDKIEQIGNSIIFTLNVPTEFLKYIAPKGSVAIDGVSLTVVDVLSNSLTVSLVIYTLEHTNLGNKKPGDLVNIETDLIAKYIVRKIGNIIKT